MPWILILPTKLTPTVSQSGENITRSIERPDSRSQVNKPNVTVYDTLTFWVWSANSSCRMTVQTVYRLISD